MWLILLLVVSIAGLVTILYLRRGNTDRSKADPPTVPVLPRSKGNYWGVQVLPPQNGVCCPAMQQLQGRCFPKSKVPPLPLPGCTQLYCHCRYEYLAEERKAPDRRYRGDRRMHIRFETGQADRRVNKDRRSDNRVWDSLRH